MHILIIDDEAVTRMVLERVLTRAGHTVCWSATGVGGLRLMASEQPDLVLLDMMLGPEMNGWEVADHKKRDPEIAAIPTIILTGLRPEDVHMRGTPAESAISEILLVLSKPIVNETLLKAIEHIAGLKGIAGDKQSLSGHEGKPT